jgi:hypothetical protein
MKKTAAPGQKMRAMPGRYAVCRLRPEAALPDWAAGEFCNITRTKDELAVICAADHVPAEVQAERDWRLLKLVGPFPFTATGVLAGVALPVAQAGISLLSIATYDTDYFLIKGEDYARALVVLRQAGHRLVR